jgi:hypothetical protein
MKDLVGRLSALDPDAGAAIRAITYFDRLAESRAGLEAIVRGAAVLAGCPARLVDDGRRVRVRVLADGRRDDSATPPDPDWPCVPLTGVPAPGRQAQETARLWLECRGPLGPVGAVVLERAATAARDVLDRTRGRAPARSPREDPALTELLLDAAAPPEPRLRAARRLGLDGGPVRAIALPDSAAHLEAVTRPVRAAARDTSWEAAGVRAGVGPAVTVLELPQSWRLARVALRLSAEGTDLDPGSRVVYAKELGGLVVLASAVGPGTEAVPDVAALERAGAAAPWMLSTLHAIAVAPSLRAAAALLVLHHSTLSDRLAHAEQLLGWEVHPPAGRLRLQLAFALRRLHRNPA